MIFVVLLFRIEFLGLKAHPHLVNFFFFFKKTFLSLVLTIHCCGNTPECLEISFEMVLSGSQPPTVEKEWGWWPIP